MANGCFAAIFVDVFTVKSHRYAILIVNRLKRREIRTNLPQKREQKNFHFGRELNVLELDLRNSHNQSRTRTAGQVVSHCRSWRATRIVAGHSSTDANRIRSSMVFEIALKPIALFRPDIGEIRTFFVGMVQRWHYDGLMIRKLVTFAVFLVLVAVTVGLQITLDSEISPPSGLPSVWMYSGLIMLIFSMFYVEPYYTAPKNVMTHSVAVILVLLSARSEIGPSPVFSLWWKVLLCYAATMLVISWFSVVVTNSERSDDDHWNRLAEFSKRSAVLLGESRVLYSGVFLLFLPMLHRLDNPIVITTLLFWWLLVMTNPQRILANAFTNLRARRGEVGQLFSVQSSNVFLAKAYDVAPVCGTRDAVFIQYNVEKSEHATRHGMIIDSYLLNNEKWLKILSLGDAACQPGRDKAVWLVGDDSDASLTEITNRVVGVVCEQSDIGRIRFDVVPGGGDIEEAELVEVNVSGKRVFYQVTNGITDKEMLEAKNESGFVRAEAAQLGQWNEKDGAFEKFGWVPSMNAAVLRAKSDLSVGDIVPPEYRLGKLPNTDIDFPIDVEDARSHHLALLGITGAGKSFAAIKLIEQMTRSSKVICVDLTGEYKEKLAHLSPTSLIDPEGVKIVEEKMAQKSDEENKGYKGEKELVLKYRKDIESELDKRVASFMESKDDVSLMELPDLSNSAIIIEFTEMFLTAIFRHAKANPGQNICLVIEEAHTVIPESTSLGVGGDFGATKALVNKIGQIALQGRKYGVGFIIIAQRTANVSKTVLTQCNSLICFQAFDETSFRFLENHLGKEMTAAVPRLKKYHAVVVGKAFRGNMPMIVDLTSDNTDKVNAETESEIADNG